MSSASEKTNFRNASASGEIPSFNGDSQARATDFANYFCSYNELHHQKQMLADHNRMQAYHSAILGNQDVFRDKIVMDIGTGSGILAVWAAQAGARKVYAIEYTDMAKNAEQVMKANGVENIVTVIQGAVEEIVLPVEEDQLEVEGEGEMQCIDVIVSEWMGYALLRESMLDSVIRARDKFLKPSGLMFPSHCDIFLAPVEGEDERKAMQGEYAGAMSDWHDFCSTTEQIYGVNMDVLSKNFDREQKDYYLLSSRWTELQPEAVLAEPKIIKHLDMVTCTLEEARGIPELYPDAQFSFEVDGEHVSGPVSGLALWFTSDFKSRTDAGADKAPKISRPAHLSTGPENGYTHWGQQTFYLLSSIPILRGETTVINGSLEMMRTKENARLYNCRIMYSSERRKSDDPEAILMKSGRIVQVYQIP